MRDEVRDHFLSGPFRCLLDGCDDPNLIRKGCHQRRSFQHNKKAVSFEVKSFRSAQ